MRTVPYCYPKTQDERIHDDVCRQIMWEADIQSKEIKVEVKNSAVLLSGSVETCLEKLEAEKAAKAVFGVASVTNNIEVEPKQARSDGEIAKAVVASLRAIQCVLEEVPRVSVRNGEVMLEGIVRWNFQRECAERAAEGVVGVKRVEDFIEVTPLEALSPCRQPNRRRPDSTPSESKQIGPQSDNAVRPLFFVPSLIGRG